MQAETKNIGNEINLSPIVITVCSGKGGVGKSVLVANIATTLAKNAKVLIWDTNIQFPNMHLIVGVEPPVRLNEVYNGRVQASVAVFHVTENLCILSASSACTNSDMPEEAQVIRVFEELINTTDFDYIILDTAAGISEDNMQCCMISDIILLTVTDEPTAMIDAYGLVKILRNKIDTKKINLLVNNVIDEEDANEIVTKFNLVTRKFLDIEVKNLGYVPYERAIRQSIIKQEIFIDTMAESEAGRAIVEIANSIKTFAGNNACVEMSV